MGHADIPIQFKHRSQATFWPPLVVVIALFLPQGIFADGLVFGLEALGGGNKYELEPMFADDTAFTDDYRQGVLTATNKWNTTWTENRRPLGLASIFYEHAIGDTVLLAGFKHMELNTSYDYTTYKFKPGSAFSIAPLNLRIQERVNDAETGIKIPLAFIGLPALTLTPRLGYRTEYFRGRKDGIGAGRDEKGGHNFLLYKQSNLDDVMSGPYGGGEIDLKLNPQLHIFAAVYNFGLRGRKTEFEFEQEILDNLVLENLGLEYIRTNVRSIGTTYTAGIKYKLTDTLHLHLGYTYERFRVSYPDYVDLLRFHYTSKSGASLEIPSSADLISDRLIYGQQRLREKRHVFLGVNYDLHL
jgi:hypothetical protein